MQQVCLLFESIGLPLYSKNIVEGYYDGEALMSCTSKDDLSELGMTEMHKNKVWKRLQQWQSEGVPVSAIRAP